MEVRDYPDHPEPDWEWGVARLFPPRGEWTEEDYLNLPDNRGIELSEGCLEFLPMPRLSHQLILAYLFRILDDFITQQGLGTVLMSGTPVRLWDGKIREPDIVFRSNKRTEMDDDLYWDGADLVVEIVSQHGRKRDLEDKRNEYALAGIQEYWIVDSQETAVQVLTLEGQVYRVAAHCLPGEQVTSPMLQGLSISVDAMFAAGKARQRVG
jgi:Uma2 family endonuclease